VPSATELAAELANVGDSVNQLIGFIRAIATVDRRLKPNTVVGSTLVEEATYTATASQTEFLFTGLNRIKPDMIQEATRNAREVAEKFAKDSDSRLGKIKQARQGQFSITDRDSNTAHIKKVRVVSTITYYLVD
jgi:hypothetical protein